MLLLTNKTVEKLKHDLVREGLVPFDDLNLAQETAEKNASNLAIELVNGGFITEKMLLEFIQDKLHIPFVDLKDYTPDRCCLSYVSSENAVAHNIFPLFRIEDVLTIAMSDPLDLFTINTLFEFEDISIEPVVCSESSIKEAIELYYFDKKVEKPALNWQDGLIADNISDEILRETIFDILKDAINSEKEHIFMERNNNGLNLFFNKELKGFIPSILVPRFIFELKNIANFEVENDEIPANSKFFFEYNASSYPIFASFFPTKFGARISFIINKPLKTISEYDFDLKKLDEIFLEPIFVGLQGEKNDVAMFAYTLAEYLSEKHNVLMLESQVKYELNRVAQVEFSQSIALAFDEIIGQVDLQNFEIIFVEKVYTDEQLKKLKLLAKEHIVITSALTKETKEFEYILSTDGKIL